MEERSYSIGNQINKIIRQKNLKQIDVAKELGMTPVNLSKILKKKTIDAELLMKFAKLFDVPIKYFFTAQSAESITKPFNPLSNVLDNIENNIKSNPDINNILLKSLEDKDKVIKLYEEEIKRLKELVKNLENKQ
ncbi:MAG: helix-turn-helix transcriptional regulator [Bacteroidales bacterium]|nr:helix-turn-helix transcriptional regulator [Bacteroidales bacterium]